MDLQKWNERIDAFLEEENRRIGTVMPVHRIYCQDDSDRSGGGLYNETVTDDTIPSGLIRPMRRRVRMEA